ncbi:MAG TPA: class I SAM-dependent methyltransferase [Nitrososphaeraceae archaeon]|nr:class I SAM-dependent methyltransferase [Nitrososphaeraceae archaeon]
MANKRTEQIIQEDQYSFPYHYIPSDVNGNFKLFVFWSWGINYLLTMEFLIERLKEEDFVKLIDVGCGDGRFIRELSNHLLGKKLIGVDISERAINLAKALNPDLEFRRLDVLQSDLPNDFDIVTLIEVLEHIPIDDVQPFLSSIADLQKSGGRLYITVPHSNRTTQRKHYQHFNSESINEHLQCNYKIREFAYFDKKTWYLKFLRGIMKNRFFILRHARTLNLIYTYYKNHIFPCSDESECARLFVIATKK